MKNQICWIEPDHWRELTDVEATSLLRVGDKMLVTSNSKTADIIYHFTKGDVPAGAPRITHVESVKMIDRAAGPIVASAEPNGLVNKPAGRHFVKGRYGQVWRHFEMARPEISSRLRDIMDVDQGLTNYYGFIQAIFASDILENTIGKLPIFNNFKIYQARAKFCSWADAGWMTQLNSEFPNLGLSPFKQCDGPIQKISPIETWFALERSMRERSGWRKIIEFDLR